MPCQSNDWFEYDENIVCKWVNKYLANPHFDITIVRGIKYVHDNTSLPNKSTQKSNKNITRYLHLPL